MTTYTVPHTITTPRCQARFASNKVQVDFARDQGIGSEGDPDEAPGAPHHPRRRHLRLQVVGRHREGSLTRAAQRRPAVPRSCSADQQWFYCWWFKALPGSMHGTSTHPHLDAPTPSSTGSRRSSPTSAPRQATPRRTRPALSTLAQLPRATRPHARAILARPQPTIGTYL